MISASKPLKNLCLYGATSKLAKRRRFGRIEPTPFGKFDTSSAPSAPLGASGAAERKNGLPPPDPFDDCGIDPHTPSLKPLPLLF